MAEAQFSYFSASTGKPATGVLRLEDYQLAERHGMRVSELVNAKYPDADPRFGTAFQQGMRSLGIFTKGDKEHGITKSTVRDVLTGECTQKLSAVQLASSPYPGGSIVSPNSPVGSSTPASRVFMPEVVMDIMVENLMSDYGPEMQALNGMLAMTDSIQSEIFTDVKINTSAPEAVKALPIAQNSLPRSMVSITSSQTSYAIQTMSVGLQISDQATANATIDLVGIILASQAEGQRKAKLWEDIASIVSGNTDTGHAALSVTDGTAFDSGMTGGVITHTGWLKMLNDPSRTVSYDSMMMTLDDVIAVQNRTGRPLMFDPRTSGNVNSGNAGTYGLNVEMNVMNFSTVMPNVLIVPDSTWAAKHLLAFDSRYALRKVVNATANYAAVEQMVLQRTQVMRFDFGEVLTRLRDEAFLLVDYS